MATRESALVCGLVSNWVSTLSLDDVKKELSDRGITVHGTAATFRNTLLKSLRAQGDLPSSVREMCDVEQLTEDDIATALGELNRTAIRDLEEEKKENELTEQWVDDQVHAAVQTERELAEKERRELLVETGQRVERVRIEKDTKIRELEQSLREAERELTAVRQSFMGPGATSTPPHGNVPTGPDGHQGPAQWHSTMRPDLAQPQAPVVDPRAAYTYAPPPPPNRFSGTGHSYGRDSRDTRTTPTQVVDMLRKWNLNFSGREDADLYIGRLEDARRVLPISDEDMLAGMPVLFSGLALIWFRDRQHNWRTFDEFTRAFRIRFIDPDFEHSLLIDIERRTQGAAEPVLDYLTYIRSMMNRVVPRWSERAMLDRAYRNMLPALQTMIPREEICTLDQLEITAVRRETVLKNAKSFVPPPPPNKMACPGMAYRLPKPRRSNLLYAEDSVEEGDPDDLHALQSRNRPSGGKRDNRRPPPKAPAAPVANPPGVASDKPERAAPNNPAAGTDDASGCWECGQTDHFRRECPHKSNEKTEIYCYGCRKPGVMKPNCPDCSGNGAGGQ